MTQRMAPCLEFCAQSQFCLASRSALFEHSRDVKRGVFRRDARSGIQSPIQFVTVFNKKILKQRPIVLDIGWREPIAPSARFFDTRNPLMLGVDMTVEGDSKT